MGFRTNFLIVAAILALTVNAKLKSRVKGDNELNPVNSSVTYNESNQINTAQLGVPFVGEFRTGYIIVNSTTKSRYFYWLYAAGGATNAEASLNDSAPLFLWMQGGPGCADGTGQFNEIGPYTIVSGPNGTLQAVPAAINWNDEYHLLFLDNPVGVGYSVGTDNVNSATIVAEYIQTFLIRFFQIYTSLANQPLYVFAESYGGHYGPAVVQKLISDSSTTGIKITGLGIVDGWVNPYYQATSYAEFAYAAGLIDPAGRDTMKLLEAQAKQAFLGGRYVDVANIWGSVTDAIGYQNVNVYSFRNYNDNMPPGSPYADWLNNNTVKAALGVDASVTYNDCVGSSYNAFLYDLGSSYDQSLSYILNSTSPQVKVLIMNGADDLIVNTDGVERFIRRLNWVGAGSWLSADKTVWWKNSTAQDYAWGVLKRYDQFTYAVVYKAGHEVPMYVPDSARNLLERFITNNWN